MTLDLGAINRTGGLVNFVLPTSGNIKTSSATLGGWAMINSTDYAKVVSNNIVPFDLADYATKDNAATWGAGEVITETSGGPGFQRHGTAARCSSAGCTIPSWPPPP